MTDMPNMQNLEPFLSSMLMMLLQFGLQVFVIVLLIVNRKRFKEFLKTGLIIAVIAFVMNLPFQVLSVFMMDAGKAFGGLFRSRGGESLEMAAAAGTAVQVLMILLNVAVLAEASVIVCLSYVTAAAEWDKLRPRPFPVIMRTGEKAWLRIGIAALVGVGAAVASLVFVRIFNVHESEVIRRLFPNPFPLPPAFEIATTVLLVSAAALTEEVLFRGALLGFLFRVSRDRLFPQLASVFAVSLVWALMHLPNTDSPVFKITQIFLLGLVLAEFTRRWSLESAIVLHFSLNLTSVILEYAKVF